MTIQLGIAPINWCNDDDPNLGKDISFAQCIQEMAIAGFVGTELGHKFPQEVPVLKSALSHQGLQLSSAWFSTYFTDASQYQETQSHFMEKLAFLRAMGAKFINVCECGHAIQGTDQAVLGAQKPVFNTAQWHDLINGLHAIGRIAHSFGMQVVYHYHAGTGVFTAAEIDYLMNHTSPQLIALLLDTGHAAFADVNPLQLIEAYGNRIQYVHLKDIRRSILNQTKQESLAFMDAVRAGVFTVPGDGDLDFTTIINALKGIQYQGWMIVEAEQDPAKAPPLALAQKAYQHIQSLI